MCYMYAKLNLSEFMERDFFEKGKLLECKYNRWVLEAEA